MSTRTACLAAMALMIAPGCSSDQPPAKPGASSTSSTPAKESKNAEPAVAIEVSKDMKDFMNGAESFGFQVALVKYADGVATTEMTEREYSEPKLVKSEKRGDRECYTVDALSGADKFTFELYWAGDKIVEIKQLAPPPGAKSASSGTAKKSDEAEGPAVDLSEEMKDFISGIDGSEGDGVTAPIDKSLAKYAAADVDISEIGQRAYDNPRVTAVEKQGDRDCYTLVMTGGVFTFTYELCWEGGKVVAIKKIQEIETKKLKK
jgi:hypothetical protein